MPEADLEHLDLPSRSFDLAYSSPALHYIENLPGLLAGVRAALVPGGGLIFSVEHPIFTAPANPGWSVDAAGRRIWPLDGYLDEGPRETDWLAKGVIKQHRTIGTYVNLLVGSGLSLSHVDEWGRAMSRSRRGRTGPTSDSALLPACGLQPLGRGRRSSARPEGLIEGRALSNSVSALGMASVKRPVLLWSQPDNPKWTDAAVPSRGPAWLWLAVVAAGVIAPCWR